MPFLNICQSKIPNVTRGLFIRQNLLHVRKYSKTLIRLKKLSCCMESYQTHMKGALSLVLLKKRCLSLILTKAATRGVLSKTLFLQNAQNSKENTCARVSFLIKLQPATLLKRRLWHRYFPVNFTKFLRTPF